MQTLISLSAFVVLGLCHLGKIYALKKQLAHGIVQKLEDAKDSIEAHSIAEGQHDPGGHTVFWLGLLSNFHKAQCFYSIALQIASFVRIYGKSKDRMDEMFLLFISADGLIPVTITLYTLLLLRHAQVYDIILAAFSTLLATITGFSIILGLPSITSMDDTKYPASCGNLSPQWICAARLEYAHNIRADRFFAGGAIALDVVTGFLTLSYFLPGLMTCTGLFFLNRPRTFSEGIRMVIVPALHSITLLSILACAVIELYLFSMVLGKKSPSITHDWSFGQIVGITIWSAVIIDFIKYEACRLPLPQ